MVLTYGLRRRHLNDIAQKPGFFEFYPVSPPPYPLPTNPYPLIPMIELTDVCKTHYRGDAEVLALRGVSCEIPTGSFTFVVGPSGSGKSTLLYLIGALDEPTSGRIAVDGRSLAEFDAKARDKYRRLEVGFIFQNFNLLGNLHAVGVRVFGKFRRL